MKKIILGLILGASVSLSTASFASDYIQARLFPVQFEINGKARDLAPEYKVLNYEGHAYVPVRFITEHLGATVTYDTEEQKIKIQSNPLNIQDSETKGISVGNIQLTHESNRIKVTGQLIYEKTGVPFYDQFYNTFNNVEATLYFMDEDGNVLGEASIRGDHFGSEPRVFETYVVGNIEGYASIKLYTESLNQLPIYTVPDLYERDIPLSTILQSDFSNVSKIEIRYGDGQHMLLEEKEKIKLLSSLLAKIKVTKAKNQELPTGYLYYLDIYVDGKKTRYSNNLVLNKVKYVPASSSVDLLDEYVNSLK